MSEKAVLVALRDYFPANEYAVIPQVPNATSFRKSRTADALVMGLWESRGIHLHGVEIKSYRSDWIREKKNGLKAEEIAQYCDYWWIATTSDSVVKPEEIPDNWGLLVMTDKGKLRVAKKTVKLNPQPITRAFLAGIMRAVEKATVPFDEFDKVFESKLKSMMEAWKKDQERNADQHTKRRIEQYDKLIKNVEAFEKTSGISLDRYSEYFNGEIGKAVATLRYGHNPRVRKQIEDLNSVLARMLSSNQELLAVLADDSFAVSANAVNPQPAEAPEKSADNKGE